MKSALFVIISCLFFTGINIGLSQQLSVTDTIVEQNYRIEEKETTKSRANGIGQQGPSDADMREVVFPSDRSLGRLFIRDANTIDTFFYNWSWVYYFEINWQYAGEATGRVTIPSGKRLALIISSEGWKDLSPLIQLKSDGLDALAIQCRSRDADKPADQCLPYICSLSELKMLSLEYTNITNEGLEKLKQLKSLTHLSIESEKLDDTGIDHVAEIKSLKNLRIHIDKVTDKGLSHLAKLTSLEELSITSGNLNDDSLFHLAKLPRLRDLLLMGKNISSQGLIHLKNMQSLKKLYISGEYANQDWLENLSKLTQIEELVIEDRDMNDEFLGYLKSMRSLKKLYLEGFYKELTDKGLAHLSKIQSLESLEIYGDYITDKGLEHLAELQNLRTLKINNSEEFTDDGLKHLTRLKNLECLEINISAFTDNGMSMICVLKNLKELSLSSQMLTDKGLAELSKLKSLRKLCLSSAKTTVSGLNHLNNLSNLTELHVSGGVLKDIQHGDSVLDIGALTRLEKLSLRVYCDEDMACLAKLTNLRSLSISNPGLVTDKGIAYLKNLTSLNNLDIFNAHLTDDGLKHIANMNKLVELKISGDFTEQGLCNLERLRGLTNLLFYSPRHFSPEALQRLHDKLPYLLRIEMEIREHLKKIPKSQVGQKLPDFDNISLEFSAETNKDKMILVCFFDMGQRPSRNCILQLSKRAQELKAKDVVIIAVQVSKIQQEKLNEWIKKNNIPFHVGMIVENEEQTCSNWGVKSLPWLILTDRQHIVRAEGFSLDELNEKISGKSEK